MSKNRLESQERGCGTCGHCRRHNVPPLGPLTAALVVSTWGKGAPRPARQPRLSNQRRPYVKRRCALGASNISKGVEKLPHGSTVCRVEATTSEKSLLRSRIQKLQEQRFAASCIPRDEKFHIPRRAIFQLLAIVRMHLGRERHDSSKDVEHGKRNSRPIGVGRLSGWAGRIRGR